MQATLRLVRGQLGGEQFFRLILGLMLYSLVPLAEIFLFIYLGNLIGNFLVVALAALMGAGGALVALDQAQRVVAKLRARIQQGRYPGREFLHLAGILIGAILLVTPGFITDICGYLMLVPAVREALGKIVIEKLDRHFKEIYKHLRLYALADMRRPTA